MGGESERSIRMSPAAPFGSWPSPVTAERVVAAAVRLGEVRVGESEAGTAAVFWSEGRPWEGGRTQLVRRDPDGSLTEVLPEGWSTRTTVHEYGGGAWWLAGPTVFFVREEDQRLYRLDPGFDPVALTPPPLTPGGLRYADGVVSDDWRWVICVQEVHPGEVDHPGVGGPLNRLVVIPATGGRPSVVFDGSDFVASPRLNAATGELAFVTWDHPDMPWDDSQLRVGTLVTGGGPPALVDPTVVAGGDGESVQQPEWGPDGRLWFISDRSDWWNLWVRPAVGIGAQPATAHTGEVGVPQWVFAQSRYAFLGDGRVVFAHSSDGVDHLAVLDPATGAVDNLDTDDTSIHALVASGATAVYVGASFTREAAVLAALVGRGAAVTSVLRPPRELGLSTASLSIGRSVTFPTGPDRERVAHGLVYLPAHAELTGPPRERPPLVVMIHGGPTAAARPELRLEVQYWTSRGFAVMDVNYRGSTGYGRRYRDELRGGWGVYDVEDCVAAARFLADGGHVDPERMVIRGGSAGGFTALAALTFGDTFAAGASLYGVTDLALLAADTHKFESRYLDGLVGPWPEAAPTYEERSPLHHVDRLRRPVIAFQGLDDRVVPPNQATLIVDALRLAGVPVSYLPFAGEGHGFRSAATIVKVLESELSFYCQVLGLPHPPDLQRVPIDNLG